MATDPNEPPPARPIETTRLPPDARALWARVEELWRLIYARDEGPIRDAIHPRYAGWEAGSPRPHDREFAVRSVTAMEGRMLRHELEPLAVEVYEGTTGVCHYRYAATVLVAGAERQVTGRWTEVYVRAADAWRLVAVAGGPAARADPRHAPIAAPHPE